MKNCLLDTDILINWLRGEKWEKSLLLTPGIDFYISQISRKELFQYRNVSDRDKKKIVYFLHCLRELLVTPEIASKASILIQKYRTHHLQPADALIAATAWHKQMPLVTHNLKHFKVIKEIQIYE